MRWFHGGYPGLAVDDWIEPPDVTETTHRLSAYVDRLAPHGRRTDVVYVTHVQDVARAFAALYPDGSLYAVELDTPVGVDPDAPDLGVMCRRAQVLEVVRPRVAFAHRPVDGWIRMLRGGAMR